jgi:hypothetical protein
MEFRVFTSKEKLRLALYKYKILHIIVWKYARFWNYLLILLQMVYQAPFIHDDQGPSSWQSILGLEKLEFTAHSIISNGIIFDLIIMALLRFQKRVIINILLYIDRPV